MKRVFIINHSVQNCGVYQYGKRFANVLSDSENVDFKYFELNDFDILLDLVNEHNPSVIIYNHLTGTMPWFTSETSNQIRGMGIKQGLIVHNVNYSTFFDFFLHQDPNYSDNDNNYHILRPLPSFVPKPLANDNVVRIGSFGFGFKVKFYPQICEIVNASFESEQVELRLHLTESHFCPNRNDMDVITFQCRQKITRPNIKLIVTNDFMSNEELLNFLSGNSLNIFLYQKYNSYNGISSVIDYALAVKRPIAICQSNMFNHIMGANPSICVENNNLKNILSNGFAPLEHFYERWSRPNFIRRIEEIIKEI